MVQLRSQARLAQQAGPDEFVVAKHIRQDFDRHLPFQAQVAPAIDHARTAFTEAAFNFVVRERLANHTEPALLRTLW